MMDRVGEIVGPEKSRHKKILLTWSCPQSILSRSCHGGDNQYENVFINSKDESHD